MIKKLLQLEALLVLSISIWIYFYHFHFSLFWFLVLLLSPDISTLGYIINSKVGTIIYNLFHTYFSSITCTLLGILVDTKLPIAIGLIWIIHIGMDRVIGYGLKHKDSMKETHLQMLK
ncbi:DUF4260 domain-containing protein [Priestia aryabhattai]|uniref:DUF4260 domain-containing protein n=1 Tax=Priestia aryabhattai TaxID=412384 RepID=UPI0018735406|nr:DUF4260 domain-containing protein [Priestia aryabhattai]MBE5102241.1 DUF4260 domain-containing protein [Priestia aryabhattai]